MYLHIDCNTFFASCEVATRPELEGRPVVVANVNEAGGGIILALNAQAKQLGLKRGNPVFQVKRLLERNGVEVCKADHKKYRRISAELMEAVKKQEIVLNFIQYSIDEFFGELPLNDEQELRHYAEVVKNHIFDATSIPVSCGVGQSYTLAKTATHFAKHYSAYNGVCVIMPEKREKALSLLNVSDIWGVGRRVCPKLEQMGIHTALQLAEANEQTLSREFSVAVLRTQMELRGVPAIDLQRPEQQKSIMQSQTFGYMTDQKSELETYVRRFVAQCCVKLRAQHTVCQSVTLFLATNRHRDDLPQYSNSATAKFPSPLADTPKITKLALQLLEGLYRRGYQYKQAGVILGGIIPEQGSQTDLFTQEDDEKRRKLMQLADSINQKFGDDTLGFGR